MQPVKVPVGISFRLFAEKYFKLEQLLNVFTPVNVSRLLKVREVREEQSEKHPPPMLVIGPTVNSFNAAH
ncbi:hypothetical protein GCM10022422_17410 [Flavobacterium ginsengisoli]|uniref:Uncharacterized protein n=1 Tax=Flavobacterium ginsengisoli TaxID=871694 RepID=A0ABP7FAI0_9FLAO